MNIAIASILAFAVGADEKKPADRVTLAKEFVMAHAKGDFQAATKEFDEVMLKASPADKMESVWKQLQKQIGPFQKILETREDKTGKYDIVHVICQFEKVPFEVRVVFDKAKITGYHFRTVPKKYDFTPPNYARPDSYKETDVVIGSGEWKLPGALTLPTREGPFPAVVLVHGSGPHDRDETIGPNKPFRDLAWGLASQGIAVLRYEKRTRHFSGKLNDSLTIREEVIDDAVAAAAYLRTRKEINKKRVFVLGHSLGANVGPRIGVDDPELAGLILLAGNSRPLEDVILEQIGYIVSLKGESNKEGKELLEKIQKQVARVKDPKLARDTPAADLPLNVPAAYWLALREYRPTEVIAQFKRPIFVLQGERDYQVTMVDFAGWKKALKGRDDVKLRSYPKLNHLFMEGEGKIKPTEYEVAGNVAMEVINDIARWIKGR